MTPQAVVVQHLLQSGTVVTSLYFIIVIGLIWVVGTMNMCHSSDDQL
jgi:hypothetical protein